LDKCTKKDEIIRYFPINIRSIFDRFESDFWRTLISVRFSIDSPLVIEFDSGRVYLGQGGITAKVENAYFVTRNDIERIFEMITNSSIYAYGRYVNEGFVTLAGGNRVGIAGNCTIIDGKVSSVNNIFSLYFRIAHEKTGVSDCIINNIYNKGKVNNTLIISPPGCGKTTFLRDIAKTLGNYNSFNSIIVCALIDERYELACARDGHRNLDVGINNFVISGCSKSTGILLATRSMAPDVIIVDEMCHESDYMAAVYAKNSGCSIIASVHGKNEKINELNGIHYADFFETVIVLSSKRGPGTIEKIIGG